MTPHEVRHAIRAMLPTLPAPLPPVSSRLVRPEVLAKVRGDE